MLKKRKWQVIWACAAGILMALSIASMFVQIYGNLCAKNEYTGQKECAAYHIAPFIIFYVGEFLDAHNGALTAIATCFIAWFTLTLWSTTTKQAGITNDALKMAREEFISTHRPRLKIREIEWDNNLGIPPIKISYAVVNVGETTAHIFERRNRIYFSQTDEPLHGLAGWTGDQMSHEETTIPGGKRSYCQFESTGIINVEWPSRVLQGDLGLKVVGEIGYRDDNGIERWVGFLRSYDWKFRRFRIMDDPDHEYED